MKKIYTNRQADYQDHRMDFSFNRCRTCSLGRFYLKNYYRYEQTNDAQVQEYVNPVISRAGGFIVAVKFEENQEVKKEILFY